MTRPVICVETGVLLGYRRCDVGLQCKSGYIRNGMAHEYPVRGFHFKKERGEELH